MRESAVDYRARPVVNLFKTPAHLSPQHWNTGQSGQINVESIPGAFGNRSAVRYTRTNTVVAASLRMGQTATGRMPIPYGRTVTLMFRHRCSPGFAGLPLQVRPTIDNGSTTLVTAPPLLSSPAGGVYREVLVIPPTSNGTVWSPQVVLNNQQGALGDWLELGDAVVVEGVYTGPYVDGDSPGCRWLGTIGASESAGHPYTLESIAGRPDIVQIGQGLALAPLSLRGTAVKDITIFSVMQVSDMVPTAYRPGSGLNTSPEGNASTALGGFEVKRSPGTSASVQFGLVNTASQPSRFDMRLEAKPHVTALSWSNTEQLLKLRNGLVAIRSAPLPAQNILYEHVRINNDLVAWPWTSVLATYVYAKALNTETQDRIAKWLANAYAVPII